MSGEINESSGRARRERVQSKARVVAFDKLKLLKGSKHKYEVSDVKNVYEEVDEREYSKRVRERQDDDWIIDDDGAGYVEDGRDIFDDDLDDESIIGESRKRKRTGGSKISKRTCLGSSIEPERSNNIRSMLMNMPSKKAAPVRLEDDALLNDILQEIHEDISPNIDTTDHGKCVDVISSEESATAYLRNFTEGKRSDVLQDSAKNKINMENESIRELSFVTCSPKNKAAQQSDLSTIDTGAATSTSKFLFHDASATKSNLDKLEESMSHDVCAAMFQDDFTELALMSEEEEEEEEEEEKTNQLNLNSHKQEEDNIETVANKNKEHCDSKEDTFLNDCPIVSKELPNAAKLPVNITKIPYTNNAEGCQVLRFFWLDAHEDPFKQPGVVFLFGKVWIESAKTHVSCCLTVLNVERKVLVLPREKMEKDGTEKDVTFLDVYKEFSEISSRYGIMEFRSRKVVMHNCFNPNVPHTSEYMEVKYPAHFPALPDDLTGNTFSHVFGTGTNALERLLIEQRIKGPCWLDVHEPATVDNPLSWCKVEARVEKMELVTVTVTATKLPPPSVVLLALQIKTVVNSKNSNNGIALAVGLVNRDFPLDREPPPNKLYDQHFAILAPLVDKPYPYDVRKGLQDVKNVERMDSERALLSNLLAKILRLDPDIIVGHDILGFDLEIIFHQLLLHKVPNWSRLGRLRRLFPTPAVKKRLIFTRSYLCGRLPCDVMLAAKEHVQSVRSYDLETLCLSVLGKETHSALTFEEIRSRYESGEKLKTLLKLSLVDAVNTLQIICHISAIPLALQITNIAGNVMSRTLIGGRAERNESLLLHAFHEKNFIPPEKNVRKIVKNLDFSEEIDKSRGKSRKKPNYSGGLVLEPKKGLYDKMVLVMDFNSLYPSIILEYNICFTTVTPSAQQEENILPDVPSRDLEIGILPAEIRKLVESRVMVRKLMQDSKLNPVERSQLHIRQIALKLMANSMYGCLGFSNARFYAKHLAALITAKGREILMNTKEIVEGMSYEVIYGDTDSIMINTNCGEFDEVMKIGKKILQVVNKMYHCVNLDIDGVFKFMLLLKKKKYAVKEVTRLSDGTLTTKTKYKGLDIVRRDWSRLAVECGNFVVEQLLSDLPLEDRLVVIEKHLKSLSEDLRAGRVPLPLLTITKQLTRSVEQYGDAKSQPHVLVAKRLIQRGLCHMKSGDAVSYIICEDGSSNTPVQRAYHLDELKLDKNLKIDYKYYLAHQIHPVINRLMDPVESIDAVRIAEILDLDLSPYQQAASQREARSQEDTVCSSQLFLHEPEHYEKCMKFSFMCVLCKTENVMDKPYKVDETGGLYAALSRCSNSQCAVSPIQYIAYIQNCLTMLIRSLVRQYSKGVLICEDPACPVTTRLVTHSFYRAYPVCPTCNVAVMYKQMSDKELYTEFLFLKMIFDLTGFPDYKKIQVTPEVKAAYDTLHSQVTGLLKHSFYSKVDLGLLFKYCNVKLVRGLKQSLQSGDNSDNLQSKRLTLEKSL